MTSAGEGSLPVAVGQLEFLPTKASMEAQRPSDGYVFASRLLFSIAIYRSIPRLAQDPLAYPANNADFYLRVDQSLMS